MRCMGPSRTTLSNWVHYLLSSTSSASHHLLTKTQNHQVGSNTVVRVPTLKGAVTTLGVKSCQATPLFVPGSWTFLEQHGSGHKETNVTRWISRGGIKEPNAFLVLNTEPFSTDGSFGLFPRFMVYNVTLNISAAVGKTHCRMSLWAWCRVCALQTSWIVLSCSPKLDHTMGPQARRISAHMFSSIW